MLLWYKIFVFALATGVIAYISRSSLLKAGSHGFYRFFVWELIVVLFLLNVEFWFRTPFAWYQILSWILLIGCIVPLVLGVRHLKQYGRPVEVREGSPELMTFEKTSRLVTSGIYHYIRHPLYSSLLLLTWGIFFKQPGGWGLLLATVVTFLLIATARADEAECLHYFGPAYQEYMQHTKRFLPFLF